MYKSLLIVCTCNCDSLQITSLCRLPLCLRSQCSFVVILKSVLDFRLITHIFLIARGKAPRARARNSTAAVVISSIQRCCKATIRLSAITASETKWNDESV